MHVMPGFDQLAGAADGLAVALHHLARPDGPQRDLVARGNGLARYELKALDR
jgi:hypothetical protein